MQTPSRPIELRPSRAISLSQSVASRANPFRPVVAALAAVVSVARRGAVYAELGRMTDRQLADIGLTRGEIRRVNDPEFCAARLLRPR